MRPPALNWRFAGVLRLLPPDAPLLAAKNPVSPKNALQK
jgi:hypothetical protein